MDRAELRSIVRAMSPADLSLYYHGGSQKEWWESVRRDPLYIEDILEIMSEATRFIKEPVPELTYSLFAIFTETGSRVEYEKVYFERRRRLNTFALLSLLEPESRLYETELCNILWSICSEYTWCLPAHINDSRPAAETIDLFSAETGFALSEIMLLLGERVPDVLRSRVIELIEERLFQPLLTKGPYFWEDATHNWSAVCAGAIGSAALLLVKDADKLTDILLRTERSMNFYLQGFGGDGACLEGLGYWNYGFGFFVYYADLLRRRSGGVLDWFRNEKVKNIALFQQKCYLGGESVVNFSDSLPKASVQLGLSHFLADIYSEFEVPPLTLRADYREDHCSRWAPAFRNLIWRNARAASGSGWGTASFYLTDAEWMISRVAGAEGSFGFAAKGGHNDEPHNHNDLGQFILHAGEAFIADLGCGEYTREYFGEGRYAYDCNGSQGHSVPIIDGCYQSSGKEHTAVVLEASTSDAEDRLVVELSGAYKNDKLVSLKREWVWHKELRTVLTLTDEYRFHTVPGSLTERMVTLIQPVVHNNGTIVLSGNGLKEVRVQYDPVLLQPSIGEHSFRNHFGVDTVWYSLDFIVKVTEPLTKAVFRFEFVDKDGGQTNNGYR
jgi:hypothetical protein